MLAVRVDHHGGPDEITVGNVPDPDPGSSDVVIDVAAASVNFSDILLAFS